jgi:hypothetical protein
METCGEFGTVNNDGTCNYDCSKIYPRCATCSDDKNQKPKDLSKIKCTSTVHSDPSWWTKGELFDTQACVQKGKGPDPAIYGCPIKPDVGAWHPYVGSAWHSPNKDDVENCHSPMSSPACRLQNSPNVDTSNYCWGKDFTNHPDLKDVDTTGLSSDRHVAGFAAGYSTVSYPAGNPLIVPNKFAPPTNFITGMPNLPTNPYVAANNDYWNTPCVPV